MICAELETLEGQLDDIIAELENPSLSKQDRERLEVAYAQLAKTITQHQESGHKGKPCYEE